MRQPVRLIVWDMPLAAWTAEFAVPQADLSLPAMVATLAHRGIPGAICPNQNADAFRSALSDAGCGRYMLYAGAEADSDELTLGEHIAGLLGRLRLAAHRVLLVSPRPESLREAVHVSPGLQFTDTSTLAELLDDPRLQGGEDAELEALGKLHAMAWRDAERRQAATDVAYLRGCGLRARLDYGIATRRDEAIRLARTLPDLVPGSRTRTKAPAAQDVHAALLGSPTALTATLSLRDRHGDFGTVAIYAVVDRTLRFFCVSEQVADLGVPAWLYHAIGRPPLADGKALFEPEGEQAGIDWIALDDAADTGDEPRPASWIAEARCRGGWEAEYAAHRLAPITGRVVVEGSRPAATGLRVRIDHSTMLRHALERHDPASGEALAALGFVDADFRTGLFARAPHPAAIVFAPSGDTEAPLYRHRPTGTVVPISWARLGNVDLTQIAADDVPRELRGRAAAALERLRAEFTFEGLIAPEQTVANLRAAFGATPEGCTVFLILAEERRPGRDGAMRPRPAQARLNESIRAAAAEFPCVSVLATEERGAGGRAAVSLIAAGFGRPWPVAGAADAEQPQALPLDGEIVAAPARRPLWKALLGLRAGPSAAGRTGAEPRGGRSSSRSR